MKKINLVYVVIICVLLTSCNPKTNATSTPLPPELNSHYINTGNLAGFTLREADLYNTRWVLEIYNLFQWKIPNKENLVDTYSKSNLNKLLEDSPIPREDAIISYIRICNLLDIDIEKEEKSVLLQEVYSSTNDQNVFVRMKSNQMLNTSFKDKKKMSTYLQTKLKEGSDYNNKVNYLYLLNELDHELVNKEEVEKISMVNRDMKLSPYDIHDYFREMKLKEDFKINIEPPITESEVSKLVQQVLAFSNNASAQTLYKTLYITRNVISSEDIAALKTHFDGLCLRDGWYNPIKTLEVYATFYGLTSATYLNELDHIDKGNVKKFLEIVLQYYMKKETLTSLELTKIKDTLQSGILIEDENLVEKYKVQDLLEKQLEYYSKQLTEDANTNNPDMINALLALLDLTKTVNGELKLDNNLVTILMKNINELHTMDRLYYTALIDNYSDRSNSSVAELNKLQEKNGSFQDDLQSTLKALKIYSILNQTIPNKNRVNEYITNEIKTISSGNDDFIQKGYGYESLLILENMKDG